MVVFLHMAIYLMVNILILTDQYIDELTTEIIYICYIIITIKKSTNILSVIFL